MKEKISNKFCEKLIEKRIAFIASVEERQQQLKIVINALYDQVDLIHLILNWYTEIPQWIKELPKIFAHLNPENKNAHDSVWQYVEAENVATKVNGQENYYFICDDDLLYPKDYVSEMIKAVDRYKKSCVITCHGANIQRPVESYLKSRNVYGFSDPLERDIFVDMAGCGTVAFHSSTIKPILQHFPIPYCRDLWFSILAARQNVKIISIARPSFWIIPLETSGETVYEATQQSEKLQFVKDKLLKEALVSALYKVNKIKSPKVSVIMPVYNGIRFLDRAIQSILNQTEKDFEFIIIDDGSSEPVFEKIKSYSDSRIKVYRENENKGLTFRLNQCLQIIKGKFVVRMDADDVSLETRIEKQLLKFEKGVGFVGCWASSIDEIGNPIIHFVDKYCRCSDEDIKIKYLKSICMADPTSIYSIEAVQKIGYFDPLVYSSETYNYNCRILQFFEGKVVPEILYFRTVRHDSIMRMVKVKQNLNVDLIALANQRALEFPILKDLL